MKPSGGQWYNVVAVMHVQQGEIGIAAVMHVQQGEIGIAAVMHVQQGEIASSPGSQIPGGRRD